MLELFLLSNSFGSTKEGSDKRHAVCRPDPSISWLLPWTNLSYVLAKTNVLVLPVRMLVML